MNDSHDNEAAAELRAYFEPDGFPGFTVEDGRAWTPQQVRDALTHHREYLRQIIEPTVRAVLAENETMRQQLAGTTEQWAFQYTSYGVTETSLPCGSREEAEQESGRHQWHQGAPIVRRLVGEWQPAGPAQDERAATGGTTSEGN